VVDTPSARAVDLGCQYTLNVDDRGDGLLKVTMGWVAFDTDGRESFIPAGAACRTRKRGGPESRGSKIPANRFARLWPRSSAAMQGR